VTNAEVDDEATVEVVESNLAVISGNPDVEDVAALTAVLAGVLEELAAEQGRREAAATSAWARSQRGVRAPIHPGPGAWRSFSG